MELLWQKVLWLSGMLLITAAFSVLPLLYFRTHTNLPGQRGARVLGLLQCAAAGVFLCTCLLDLVPDYLASMDTSLQRWGAQTSFPIAMFIIAVGFLLVLLLEQLAFSCCAPGDPSGEGHRLLDEGAPLMGGSVNHGHGHAHAHGPGGWVRVATFALALSVHSAFEGLACGLQLSAAQLARLCGSLFLHKALVALGLGLELWAPGKAVSRAAAATLAAVFSLASPLGMLGGALVTLRAGPAAPDGNTMVRSVLEGVSAGTFVFVTFVEILPQGMHAPGDPMLKMLSLLLGFSVITATLFIDS